MSWLCYALELIVMACMPNVMQCCVCSGLTIASQCLGGSALYLSPACWLLTTLLTPLRPCYSQALLILHMFTGHCVRGTTLHTHHRLNGSSSDSKGLACMIGRLYKTFHPEDVA
jgi:hypothetical protein